MGDWHDGAVVLVSRSTGSAHLIWSKSHVTHSEPTSATDASQVRVAAIIVAAGLGSRFGGGVNKVLLDLAGEPVWVRSVRAMRSSLRIKSIVVVVRAEDEAVMQPIARSIGVDVVIGGEARYDSVRNGLAHVTRNLLPDLVAIHDAARPLVTAADVDAVIEAAARTGAAILATPVRGTIKRDRRGVTTTVDRNGLWEALTPQVFRTSILCAAYARHRGRPVTDDAELVERSGVAVTLVSGSPENIKITQREDLRIAASIFSSRNATNE